MAAGRKLFYHLPVRVNHDSRQWRDGPYSALDRNGSAVRGELQRFPGQMTIDVKVKEWSGTEKRKALTQAGQLLDFHINGRSEEHTSELQSHLNLVCRLLLEKKKYILI